MVWIRSLVWIAVWVFSSSVAQAEIEFVKVVDIQGRADTFDPQTSQWSGHAPVPFFLKEGSKLRTYKAASAEIILDKKWDRIIHLGENTRVAVLNNAWDRFSLDEGSLFILSEDESRPVVSSQILTRHVLVKFSVAGVGIHSDPEGSRVEVFGDTVEVFPMSDKTYSERGVTLTEGFTQTFHSDHGLEGLSKRMGFDPYWIWQAWLKNRYAEKDKLHSKRISR